MAPARPGRDGRGFTLIELIVVIILLGLLAAYLTPRYMGVTDNANLQGARTALATGVGEFNLAFNRYVQAHGGAAPQSLADLAPDHMNATTPLGDYTVVMTQAGAGGDLTLDIYNSAAVSGTPLVTSTIHWP